MTVMWLKQKDKLVILFISLVLLNLLSLQISAQTTPTATSKTLRDKVVRSNSRSPQNDQKKVETKKQSLRLVFNKNSKHEMRNFEFVAQLEDDVAISFVIEAYFYKHQTQNYHECSASASRNDEATIWQHQKNIISFHSKTGNYPHDFSSVDFEKTV